MTPAAGAVARRVTQRRQPAPQPLAARAKCSQLPPFISRLPACVPACVRPCLRGRCNRRMDVYASTLGGAPADQDYATMPPPPPPPAAAGNDDRLRYPCSEGGLRPVYVVLDVCRPLERGPRIAASIRCRRRRTNLELLVRM